MVNRKPPASQEEFFSARAIEIEILRQPTTCFFNVRASLVKRERQSIQCHNDLGCLYLPLFRYLIKSCAWCKYFDTAQEKHHALIQHHLLNFNTLSDYSQGL